MLLIIIVKPGVKDVFHKMFFISFHVSAWSVPIVAIDQLKSWTNKKKGWLVRRVPNVEK